MLAIACPRLCAIDLTYCNLLGYAAVVALRESCPRLGLIRRVPVGLTGRLNLPSIRSGGPSKLVHYWADGTFAIGGRRAELGWIAQVKAHGADGTIETRSCFCDEEPSVSPDNGRLGGLSRRLDRTAMTEAEEAAEEAAIIAAVRSAPPPPSPPRSMRILQAHENTPERTSPSSVMEASVQRAGCAPKEGCSGSAYKEILVVQSTRLPEPPASFPQLPTSAIPPLGTRVRGSRIVVQDTVRGLTIARYPYRGLSIARLALHPLPPSQQLPPKHVAQKMRAFCCVYHVDARREYERRALKSMGEAKRGAERFAAVMRALGPAGMACGGGAAEAAAQASWNEEVSSSDDDDDDEEEADPYNLDQVEEVINVM